MNEKNGKNTAKQVQLAGIEFTNDKVHFPRQFPISIKDENKLDHINTDGFLSFEHFLATDPVPNVLRLLKGTDFAVHFKPEEQEKNAESKFDDLYEEHLSKAHRDFIQATGIILLILESPHRQEYKPDNTPIAPAQGTSGRRLQELAEYTVANCPGHPFKCQPVVIANPIRRQCSLFSYHHTSMHSYDTMKELRNRVWRAIWEHGTDKEEFVRTLASLAPRLVVNACTKFLSKDEKDRGERSLQEIMTRFLRCELGVVDVLELPHPSSWNKSHYENRSNEIFDAWRCSSFRQEERATFWRKVNRKLERGIMKKGFEDGGRLS